MIVYVPGSGEKVCERMVGALIDVSGASCTPLLLRELCRLADAHTGADHRHLFPAALSWLSTWYVRRTRARTHACFL